MSGRAATALGAAVALGLVAGCFSERVPTDANGIEVDCAALLAGQPAPAELGTVVVIENLAFDEDSVHVAPGGKVTWVNCDDPSVVAHTATSDDGVWNSGSIQPGGGTFSYTFEETGTYPYHCEPHPFMTGVVTVGE